ncbi:MAG: hypothetical protein Q7S44_03230, partial [bacterium]|nr:hypothetical protein [bacterium]
KFEPTFITPSTEGGKFDLIFILGGQNLNSLGGIYSNNQAVFSGTNLVNLDKNAGNSQFGTTNIVDPEASSLSEIIGQLLPSLSLPFNQDIASNVLTGIFTATSNLQTANATTFEVVANALKAGGQKPASLASAPAAPVPPTLEQPSITFPSTPPPPQEGFDISKVLGAPPQSISANETFTVPPVVSTGIEQKSTLQSSPEEAPQGERAQSENPEADWLTPKIFKSGSIG